MSAASQLAAQLRAQAAAIIARADAERARNGLPPAETRR